MAIGGTSHGGVTALFAAAEAPSLYRAVVIQATGVCYFKECGVDALETAANKVKVPLLIQHFVTDTRVPIAVSRSIAHWGALGNSAVTLKEYPGSPARKGRGQRPRQLQPMDRRLSAESSRGLRPLRCRDGTGQCPAGTIDDADRQRNHPELDRAAHNAPSDEACGLTSEVEGELRQRAARNEPDGTFPVYLPFPFTWVMCFIAVFCLFFNTGPSNAILANVTHPSVRATAFAVNILAIHLLGDALSPPCSGKSDTIVGTRRFLSWPPRWRWPECFGSGA